jgi:hypothetical protein
MKERTPICFCQSCGAVISRLEEFGTDQEGHRLVEYCRECYLDGSFIEPEITFEEMASRILVDKHLAERQAPLVQEAVRNMLAGLKRWNRSSWPTPRLLRRVRTEDKGAF